MNYTEQLKQDVESFKNKNNGIVRFSTKELLYSVNHKIDRIEQRLIEGDKKFSAMETTLTWHKRLILGLYSILGGIGLGLLGFIKFFKGGG